MEETTPDSSESENCGGGSDGTRDEPKSLEEVGGRRSDRVVRYYSADGHLYGYRDGNEHVIVSNGRERRDQWSLRKPATRSAVTAGEDLWTIPDNWEQRMSIRGNTESRYRNYHIPETDVDVEVSVSQKEPLGSAYYHVRAVGETSYEFADSFGWGELEDALERHSDQIESVSGTDTLNALEQLLRKKSLFERRYAEEVERYAPESLFERRHCPISVNRLADPWGDIPFDESGDLLKEFLGVERETLSKVRENLSNIGSVIPSYPEVKVTVDDSAQLPDGFGVRALVEAGCSCSEAVDYYYTEVLDHSQTEWATVRGCSQSAVSGNVSEAKRELWR